MNRIFLLKRHYFECISSRSKSFLIFCKQFIMNIQFQKLKFVRDLRRFNAREKDSLILASQNKKMCTSR